MLPAEGEFQSSFGFGTRVSFQSSISVVSCCSYKVKEGRVRRRSSVPCPCPLEWSCEKIPPVFGNRVTSCRRIPRRWIPSLGALINPLIVVAVPAWIDGLLSDPTAQPPKKVWQKVFFFWFFAPAQMRRGNEDWMVWFMSGSNNRHFISWVILRAVNWRSELPRGQILIPSVSRIIEGEATTKKAVRIVQFFVLIRIPASRRK